MALARFNLVIQDENGTIVNGATVAVVNEATLSPATVYSDRAGIVSLGSSFVAADGSNAGFHAPGGSYKITVTSGASGSGPGTVKFDLASNPGGTRRGSITVAGTVVDVRQGSN